MRTHRSGRKSVLELKHDTESWSNACLAIFMVATDRCSLYFGLSHLDVWSYANCAID